MFKQKSIIALALVTSLFFAGCKDSDKDSDQDQDPDPNPSEVVDPDELVDYPYSELTPEQQKVKLENESLAFLEFGNAAKTSKAIEAFQNLANLLDEESVELIEEKGIKSVKETVEYADAYGIFTWNASRREWDKTASTSELKFVFPAKRSATSNNAVLSVNAVSSGISVTEEYSDWEDGQYVDKETTYYLPQSATAVLTIDNTEEAKIEFSAEYKDNKEAPQKADYKVTLSDGYIVSGNFEKTTENKVSAKIEYNGEVMIDAVAKSGIKIDEILDLAIEDEDIDYALYKKADAYMKLLKDLVLVYDIDIENYIKELEIIEDNYDNQYDALWTSWPNDKNHFTKLGQIEKEYSDKVAALFNKYQNVILASTKDGYKIATIEAKSEKDGERMDYYAWNNATNEWEWNFDNPYTKKYDEYHVRHYLRFNDNTLVDADTYFSEGFSKIEEKWENFVNAFDR